MRINRDDVVADFNTGAIDIDSWQRFEDLIAQRFEDSTSLNARPQD
jgi:hypothetical protein